jgi:hypothetical protein
MSTTRPPSKSEIQGTYGESNKFIPLRDDLRRSAAWLCLSTKEQIILIDFISYYNSRTNFDRDHDACTKPILYTYGMCSVVISKNTFYKCLQRLEEHQFIYPHYTAEAVNGRATRWMSNTAWKAWKPDQAQLRLLNGYSRRRAASVENPNQLRFEFVEALQAMNRAARRAPAEISAVGNLTQGAIDDLCNRNDSRRQAQR